MPIVRPKKSLGQHFLHDRRIAGQIISSLHADGVDYVVEVGPGMGILTDGLLQRFGHFFYAVEVDGESVQYLKKRLPELGDNLIEADFLDIDIENRFNGRIALIGNLPYNISSQVFFKILTTRQRVVEVVVMVQREVALRIAEKPGSRTYGILSVLLQAYFDIEYLQTVNEGAFTPPPKVKSSVIRLTRNHVVELSCNPELFVRVVKASFNQRRKMLRNAIHSSFPGVEVGNPYSEMRAEQLSVAAFVELTNMVEQQLKTAGLA